MLRELATVLEELNDAVAGVSAQALAQQAGVRIADLALDLPIDVVPVFRNGGCVLLADVTRNQADASGWGGDRSRLQIVWQSRSLDAAGGAA